MCRRGCRNFQPTPNNREPFSFAGDLSTSCVYGWVFISGLAIPCHGALFWSEVKQALGALHFSPLCLLNLFAGKLAICWPPTVERLALRLLASMNHVCVATPLVAFQRCYGRVICLQSAEASFRTGTAFFFSCSWNVILTKLVFK